MKNRRLTSEFINAAINNTIFDLGNSFLYELCAKHPYHKLADEIHAKITIIGRTYAAAIERRKDPGEINGDRFILEKVIPAIQNSDIDEWIMNSIGSLGCIPSKQSLLATHNNVTQLFNSITGMEKRSLASKYLHFHCPAFFYIYDSRAQKAISGIPKGTINKAEIISNVDKTYSKFFIECELVNDEIVEIIGRRLTPRELDKVLLALSATWLSKSDLLFD